MGRRMRPGRAISITMIALLALTLGAFPVPIAATGAETSTANERWCPREVAPYCSENAFYDFWRSQPNALETLGYPVDQPRRATNGQLIQFYERAIMEWHPEKSLEFQVLLTRLGALIREETRHVRDEPADTGPCAENCVYFEETGRTLRGEFLDYWRTSGGLAVFGFPISQVIVERNAADDRKYQVQYFERARFEFHPENQGRYRVQLGRLGAEILEANRATVNRWQIVATLNYGGVSTNPPPPAPPATRPGVRPIGEYACPGTHPIKGNTTSDTGDLIYHVPGGAFYQATKPEVCFAAEADARAAGFRRSQR